MSVFVLGIDPGFARCGVAIVELAPLSERVRSVAVIETSPSSKKIGVLATDDNFRRGRELAGRLTTIVESFKPAVIAAESMSFPRDSSSAAKVAMCWGVLCAIAYRYNLPLIQASPKQIKKVLCGVSTASKSEVQSALIERYSSAFDRFTSDYPFTKREHGFDAVGAVVACLDSEVIRMARGMAT